jgi:hypothetical protein
MSVNILHSLPFRLECFKNSLYETQTLLPFFEEHPEITVYEDKYLGSVPDAVDGILPNLREVEIHYSSLTKLCPRTISSLTLDMIYKDGTRWRLSNFDELKILQPLANLNGTLRSLEVRRSPYQYDTKTAVLLKHLSKLVPDLESLSILNIHSRVRFIVIGDPLND